MEKHLRKFLNNGRFENVPFKRSQTMSAIRGKNNRTTELRLRMALIRNRITGWKLHIKDLPGTPDFYFQDERIAIFVDGCYWHGCPKCGHIPNTRSEFWAEKISRTRNRDRKKRMALRKMGISTIRIWEHELNTKSDIEKVVTHITQRIRKEQSEKRK